MNIINGNCIVSRFHCTTTLILSGTVHTATNYVKFYFVFLHISYFVNNFIQYVFLERGKNRSCEVHCSWGVRGGGGSGGMLPQDIYKLDSLRLLLVASWAPEGL